MDEPVTDLPAAEGDGRCDDLAKTRRTTLRRHPERGSFDRDLVNAILDEAYIAHVGFVVDGHPRVLPMTFGRDGDALYLHGAVGNAMLRASADAEVCVTVTLLDGLVLARSAFHHSMNYRSVVLVGVAAKVTGQVEQRRAFDVIVDHMVAGRSRQARAPTEAEVRATLVLRLPIAEGSAKVRTGGPVEEPGDADFDVWAGQVPVATVLAEPRQDPDQHRRDLVPPTAAALARTGR